MNNDFKTKFRITQLELLNFKYWVVSVRPKQLTIGSLVISLKRDVEQLSNLTSDETAELSKVFTNTEQLLTKAFSYNKINYLCLMMVDNHVHFHVIPRYEKPVYFNNNEYKDNNWPAPPVLTSIIEESGIELKVFEYLKKQCNSKSYTVGYTTGVFDLFHIGHLNILQKAKDECDYLIVGVTTDEITVEMKGKPPIIPFIERMKIVESIKSVDKVIPKTSTNNLHALKEHKFDVFFKGDDWKNTEKGEKLEKAFAPFGVEIKYFSYTNETSSTLIRKILEEKKI